MRRAATVATMIQATLAVGIVLLAGVVAVWSTSATRIPTAQAADAPSLPLGIMRMMTTARGLPEEAFDAF